MSSTVRVFVNEKRIATGQVWKGQFLQVYPEKKTFTSEGEWRTAIYESLIPTIKFVTETKSPKKVKKEKKVNQIVIPVAVKPEPVPVKPAQVLVAPNPTSKHILNPESDQEEDHNWICGYCRKGPGGAGHRECICIGYNYSVAAWEQDHIYTNKAKKEMKNQDAAVSYYPSDWSHKNIKKATFPPGTYYIGDLCYALDEDLYDSVFGQDYDSGHYSQKNNPNHVFMLSDTGIGDGAYRGTDGHEYCVDAGILGIASESVLDPKKAPYDGGKVYTFKGNVSVSFKPYDKFQFYSDNYTDKNITIYICEEEEEYGEDSE